MSVHQFSRIAYIIRHNRAQPLVIEPVGTGATEPHANTTAGKERVPERIVFVDPQPARDTDGEEGLAIGDGRGGEEEFVFLIEHIDAFHRSFFRIRIDPFAVVTGDIHAPLIE